MRVPAPVTVTDVYLAAILEELRLLRGELAKLPQPAATEQRSQGELELREVEDDVHVRSGNRRRKGTPANSG